MVELDRGVEPLQGPTRIVSARQSLREMEVQLSCRWPRDEVLDEWKSATDGRVRVLIEAPREAAVSG